MKAKGEWRNGIWKRSYPIEDRRGNKGETEQRPSRKIGYLEGLQFRYNLKETYTKDFLKKRKKYCKKWKRRERDSNPRYNNLCTTD